ncbi:hypothetical protein ABQX22_14165 [Xanthomonas sp. WHRI 1810A]|uniref:hypothetical protein n=1 Tax=Xanthomonas sp. WHRI 1810A TaxID=3161565 RepID=UPI0032E88203
MIDEGYTHRSIEGEGSGNSHIPWVNLTMKDWASRWVILGNGQAGCVACGASQRAGDASQPFVHVEGCINQRELLQQPWATLREQLRQLPREVPT